MNGKKAKALRLLARQMQVKEVIKPEWTIPGHVQHKKVVPVVETKEDGTEGIAFKNEYIKQAVLDPQCGRAVYKRLKANGADKVLTGQG